MTAEEKIQYVKDRIDEETKISPKGPIWYFFYTVGHPDNPDEYTMLSRGEQKRIVRKLEEDKYIKNVNFVDDKNGCWLEKVDAISTKSTQQSKKRRSNLYSYISTVEQLLQNRELFQRTLSILGEVDPNYVYTKSTYEENDDLVQLLIDLKLIDCNWEDVENQTHREIGNRLIEFSFKSNDILNLEARITCKGETKIRREALELISKDIGERYTFQQIMDLFTTTGVAKTMFMKDTKWKAVFYVLSYYATSKAVDDNEFALTLISKSVHPLSFEGDEDKAEKTRSKYEKWLSYDKITLVEDDFIFGEGHSTGHINRIKEIYILTAISLFINKDGDYLCDDGSEVLKRFRIKKDEYLSVTENLEAEGVIVYEEKYYDSGHSEITYDGKAINSKKLEERISTFKKWMSYSDDVDLYGVKSLSDAIRKRYREETILDIFSGLTKGAYPSSSNSLEELLYYLLSAKKEVLIDMDGIKISAQIFDLKYHDAERLLNYEKSFFEPIIALFKELLNKQDFSYWYDNLPDYVKTDGMQQNVYENKSDNNILKNNELKFDYEKSVIIVNEKICQLPPYKKEHSLASFIFNKPVGTFIDWSEVSEAISGCEGFTNQKDKKALRDAVNRLNKRIQDAFNTDEKLISWKENSICRNY